MLGPIAYASCFIESAEAFLGREGYFSMLGAAFGVGEDEDCFGDGPAPPVARFEHFVTTDLGRVFSDTYVGSASCAVPRRGGRSPVARSGARW